MKKVILVASLLLSFANAFATELTIFPGSSTVISAGDQVTCSTGIRALQECQKKLLELKNQGICPN